LGPDWAGQTISLSLIENPLRSDRVYADQIILQTLVDSLGQFAFTGDFLPPTPRLYRIHASPCFEHGHQGQQRCRELEERIFVADNQDDLKFQSYPEGGFLCQGIPPSSDLGLHAQDLRMALPFGDLAGLTETARSLQFQQWLTEVEDFYINCKDPLLTLYALGDVLDERSEYRTQLKTAGIPFLNALQQKLEADYAETPYTESLSSVLAPADGRSFRWYHLGWALLILPVLLWYRRNKNRSAEASAIFSGLSAKEQALLTDIAKGMSNKELADSHHISLSTVKTHLNNIYRKTGAENRQQLIARIQQGKSGISTGV
jgi:DNA-binding CsgD family transcriptional regulator